MPAYFLLFALATKTFAQPPPETATVSGVVRDATTAEPVAAAGVRLFRQVVDPGEAGERQSARELATTTDADGRFRFAKVVRARYRLHIAAPLYTDKWLDHDATKSGRAAPAELVIALEPWWRVGVVLQTPSGTPVVKQQARLGVTRRTADTPVLATLPLTTTDARGRVIARFPGPGKYQFHVLTPVGWALTGIAVPDREGAELGPVRLKPVGGVSGVVLDKLTKVPVPQAVVRAGGKGRVVRLSPTGWPLTPDDTLLSSLTRSDPSDDEGRFTLLLPEGEWWLSSGKSVGLATTTQVHVRANAVVSRVVVLVPFASVVRVRMFDADGKPLSHRGYRLLSARLRREEGRQLNAFQMTEAEKGLVKITVPFIGRVRVVASVPGGVTGVSTEVELSPDAEPEVEIQLPRGKGAVSGTVVDETDTPVPTARVYANPSPAPSPFAARTPGRTSTEATGKFHLKGLLPGRYRVSAAATGFRTDETAETEVVEEGQPASVVVRLRAARPATVSGRALQPDGRTEAAAATVRVYLLDRQYPWSPGRTGTAAPNGRFEAGVPDLAAAPVPACVIARVDGAGFGVSDIFSLASGKPVRGVTVVLRPSAHLEGRVVDANGDPVPSAGVGALPTRWPVRAFWSSKRDLYCRETTTDAEGRFRLSDLAPEPHRVVLRAENRLMVAASRPLELSPGQTVSGVELRRPPLVGAIKGTVTSSARVETPPARVRLYGKHALGTLSTPADAEGHYEIAGLPLGRYTVYADGEGVAGRAVKGVTITEHEPTTTVDLELSPGGGLTGVVTAADGTPVLGARISTWNTEGFMDDDYDPTRAGLSLERVETSTRGRFAIEHLAPGRYPLIIRHPSFRSAARKVVVEGGQPTQITVALKPNDAGR